MIFFPGPQLAGARRAVPHICGGECASRERVCGSSDSDFASFGCVATVARWLYDTGEFGLPKDAGAGGAGGACTNAMLKFLSDEHPDDTWVSLLVRTETG